MKKRHLFQTAAAFCLAGMLLAFPASAAEADAPAEESAPVPVMSTETPNGTAYAWQPGGLYLKEDADAVFMDYFRQDLLYPLQTVDGVIFMALEDLRILYAPDFAYQRTGSHVTVTHAGVEAQFDVGSPQLTWYGGRTAMEAAPYERDGVLYVPLFDFMCTAFGKTQSQYDIYYGLGNSDDFTVTRDDVYQLKMFYRGKDVGKSYWTYWNNEVGRLESFTLYVPTSYDPQVPNKMIVQLHGASGNATTIPDSENGEDMMYWAEKYGYIVLWPESYVKLGNFGNWVPPAGQKEITADTDPDNPGAYPEGQLKDIALSGSNVQHAMNYVKTHWNIDSKNVFCMGISMGGCGTWYQGAFYPEAFAALSPSGAFVEPAFFPWEKITLPTLYVGGTEDRNGFDLMLEAYDYALSKGANIQDFIVVGGAPHGGEWPRALEETFAFFESHLS